jgi:DNA-binding GntR family transcriptional regulator
VNKQDEVYEVVVRRLMRAEYGFGARILVKELGAELGVSRQPIMTALNRLDGEGFVKIVPQVGCQVVSPSRNEIGDFFLMFQRFEGLLAELAATRRTDAQMEELVAINWRFSRLQKVQAPFGAEYVALNRQFHSAIHAMAHSPLLSERQHANFNMCDFFISHSAGFGRLMGDTAPEHNAIIEALERRAPDRARAVAEVHIGSITHAVLSALREQLAESVA